MGRAPLFKGLSLHHICGMTRIDKSAPKDRPAPAPKAPAAPTPKEIGGPKGPEPTRYGDWEQNGRCTDF
jgi:hypothetical protein